MSDNALRVLASVGLAIGGVFGIGGTFAPSASLRGLAWGIDGVGLVMASALLTIAFYRKGQDLVAAGFLVFVVGESLFAAVLFGVTALQIFAGTQIMPTTAPLPFYAYPVLVATFAGWIWTLLKAVAFPSSVR